MRKCSLAMLLALPAAWPLRAADAAPAAVPALDHIIVVVMENQDWSEVRNLTYIRSLRLGGAELTNSYGVTHPSQPNYLTLWAGQTLGVTSNFCPAPGSPYSAENLGHALEAAGKTWRSYSEDLPATGSGICATGGTSPLYTRKHDPWTNFSNLDHNNERVYSDLAVDIANHTLPNLAFVIPNNCNNMHNTGCTPAMGDAWLSNNVPAMIDAVGVSGCVILTWDEDQGLANGNNNHILTVFKGARVTVGFQSPGAVTHLDVLRTICDALGLAPIGQAAIASPILDIWYPGRLGVPPESRGGVVLSAPTPIPSSGEISARLWLPVTAVVEAGVYDIVGHAVRSLASGTHSGAVELRWDGQREDGSSAGAGIYFLKVRAGGHALRQKAILLR